MAVRTPGDEASLLIGLGQAIERLFHLARGMGTSLAIGLGQAVEPSFHLASRIGALRPKWFAHPFARFAGIRRVLRVAVPVLCLLIGVVLVVIYWVPGIQEDPWWKEPLAAVVLFGKVVTVGSIIAILPWVLPGLALSFFAGPEALARPAITGVDAEPLPFAEPEILMTLVIDVEAGREKPKGFTHSLYEVP